jgi:hypothetical protein
MVLFLALSSTNVSAKDIFNNPFLTTSNAFEHLFYVPSVSNFVKSTARVGINFNERQEFLSPLQIKNCVNIYFGRKIFNLSTVEGIACLQLYVYAGHGDAANFLSAIYRREGEMVDSAYAYGIYMGLKSKVVNGAMVADFQASEKTKTALSKGLWSSLDIDYLNRGLRVVPMPRSYINDPVIVDTAYKIHIGENKDLIVMYNLLKAGRYPEFINKAIDVEENGKALMLLSRAKLNPKKGIVNYCSAMDNAEMGKYCLASVYRHRLDDTALYAYVILLKKAYMKTQDTKNLEEMLVALALHTPSVKSSLLAKTLLSRYKNNERKLSYYISLYNESRLYKKHLRNQK